MGGEPLPKVTKQICLNNFLSWPGIYKPLPPPIVLHEKGNTDQAPSGNSACKIISHKFRILFTPFRVRTKLMQVQFNVWNTWEWKQIIISLPGCLIFRSPQVNLTLTFPFSVQWVGCCMRRVPAGPEYITLFFTLKCWNGEVLLLGVYVWIREMRN